MKTDLHPRSSRSGLLALCALALMLAQSPAEARTRTPASVDLQSITCHYTYGGETQTVKAQPLASPYTAPAIQVGSYFILRVVWQVQPADQAAVNIYTYADAEGGPVIIHHAAFASPAGLKSSKRWGFTGLQRVYEPMRDGELEYWCELTAAQRSKS